MEVKKSPKASLEDKKFIYLLLGFVCILSVVYIALEWTNHDVVKYEAVNIDTDFVEDIEIQQTSTEVLPPPPPPQPIEVEVLVVVENDVKTETIEITSEIDQRTEIVIAPPVAAPVVEEDAEVVFMVVEHMPEFPGGQAELLKYLAQNTRYPSIAQENGIQGRVTCQFVVNRDGSIVDVEVVRSAGDPSLDREALRVIRSMPKWKPGMQRGQAVRVKYTVPVNFRLQ